MTIREHKELSDNKEKMKKQKFLKYDHSRIQLKPFGTYSLEHIVSSLQENLLSKNGFYVKVKSFSSDTFFNIVPILYKKPDYPILLVGTNKGDRIFNCKRIL